MSWFQHLDSQVFHFINVDLANPVFDLVMPWFSWNPFFIPALIFLLTYLVWKGGARARIFVFVLIVTLIIADSIVANTLKNLIARPRPHLTESELRLLVGTGKSYAMPSAHAVNWAAGATIVLFFSNWRWFALTAVVGLAVGFSRIYNGVHYPSDVLVGYGVGATTAVITTFALEAGWRFFGAKLFPNWYRSLPRLRAGLAQPQSGPTYSQILADDEGYWLRLGYILVGTILLIRIWYIGRPGIELSFDEAYQWIWSKHLALSYYSKPPLIAFIQRLGTGIWGDNELGVRFFSPVFAAVTSLIILHFFHTLRETRLGLFLIIVGLTMPLLAVGSVIMTVDPLNVFAWTAAMVAGWRAIQPQGKLHHWLLVGFCTGLGVLSKYTALLQILSWLGIFACNKQARAHLKKPGPWIALCIVLLCLSPIVIWNAKHDWITVQHLIERGGLDKQFKLSPRYLLEFVGNELGVLNPIYFIGMIWALIATITTRRLRSDALFQFLFWMAIPVWAIYLALSFHSRILPNWIAPAVIPSLCLMGLFWKQFFARPLIRSVTFAGIAMGAFAVVLLHDTSLMQRRFGIQLPPEKDPSRRVKGWKQLTSQIEGIRLKTAISSGRPTFVICESYGLTGVVTFYHPEAKQRVTTTPLVYCLKRDKPTNQFYFWTHYDYTTTRKGHDAIYVALVGRRFLRTTDSDVMTSPPEELSKQFASVRYLGTYEVKLQNTLLHKIMIWVCSNAQ